MTGAGWFELSRHSFLWCRFENLGYRSVPEKEPKPAKSKMRFWLQERETEKKHWLVGLG
jgi:hypothetical protein